ncbi:MAG: energy transducer TonB [Bacteroidota bacterium]|nr:energy transducer TonB [Bacteroidota bacterium]
MAIHPDKHIFNPSGCIKLDSLQKYMKGGFADDTREEISMHLEKCQFCKEAMEGLTLIPDPDVQNKSIRTIREGMKGRIRRRKMSTSKKAGLKRRFNWVAAAASVVLLTGIFSIYNYLLKPDREYLAEEVNVADVSEDFADSILDKGIIDYASPSPSHKVKDQAYESAKAFDKTVSAEIESLEIASSDIELENKLLIDSIPDAFVSESVASSTLEEVMIVGDEMDVLAMAEEAEDASAKQVAGVSIARTEIEPTPTSLKKAKSAPEPAGNISTNRKINLTKPIFQNNEYKDFDDYIAKNLIYPDSALTADLPGRVILEFTIDENGIISELKVRESSHRIFKEEARRLISSSGIWQPATENGKPVSYLMFLPIDFIPPEKK